MPIECLISFDNNPEGVYYAGQELSGVVDLNVDTTKRIKAIHITVSGYAKIRWIKKGYPRDSERATCRAYRSYLSSRSYVLGSCASSLLLEWLPGEYSYTFHVILPENLPTSFDGTYGQIHYEIITTIERPGRYPKIFTLPFTVIHPLDLNSSPIYKVPVDTIGCKRFWSFCCPTGPLTVKFSTPYCGYAAGQKIHFVLYLNNESSIDITECEVKLKQEVSYESHDPQHEYRYDKHLIASKIFGNVLRWSRKVYRGHLGLPSIVPTSVRAACPIAVNYAIKIIVKPTEFHCKLKLKIPVIIGTVPIMENLVQANERLMRRRRFQRQLRFDRTNNNTIYRGQREVENNGDEEVAAEDAEEDEVEDAQGEQIQRARADHDADDPPNYVLMMPPSYEEAMALSGKFFDDSEYLQNVSLSSVAETNDKAEPFKPRYPVYYDYETPVMPPESLYGESSVVGYNVVMRSAATETESMDERPHIVRAADYTIQHCAVK